MNEPICQVNAKSGQFLSGKHEVLPCNFRSANRRSSGNSQLSSLEICSEFLCVTAFRTSARVLERLRFLFVERVLRRCDVDVRDTARFLSDGSVFRW